MLFVTHLCVSVWVKLIISYLSLQLRCMIPLVLIHTGCPSSIPNWCYIQGLSLAMFCHMGCYRGHEVLATSEALVLLTAVIMLSVVLKYVLDVVLIFTEIAFCTNTWMIHNSYSTSSGVLIHLLLIICLLECFGQFCS